MGNGMKIYSDDRHAGDELMVCLYVAVGDEPLLGRPERDYGFADGILNIAYNPEKTGGKDGSRRQSGKKSTASSSARPNRKPIKRLAQAQAIMKPGGKTKKLNELRRKKIACFEYTLLKGVL